MSRGGKRGGFQSDRVTEKSDNERSGLSGGANSFPHKIAAREGNDEGWGVRSVGESALSAG